MTNKGITYKRLICLFIIFLFSASYLLRAQLYSSSRDSASLDEKIGQMLMVGFRGLDVNKNDPIIKDINTYHLGGTILFDYDIPADTSVRNIHSPSQIDKLAGKLQAHAEIPLFIAVDQEGGKVARLKPKHGFDKTVTPQYLGSLDRADTTRYYARQTAKALIKTGINTNLAPVVDLNLNPQNPIIGKLERSFSSDLETLLKHAGLYIETLHQYGIITAVKHFPGHGSSQDDSHLGVVDVTESWQRAELGPYRNLIKQGLVDIVMTAHIYNARLDSLYPATLSKSTIQDVLRNNLEYSGVVMSDDLQMKAIRTQYSLRETLRLSIQAGVDILVFANNSIFDPAITQKAHALIKRMVEEGTIDEENITRSYERIMKLKKKYLMTDK